MMKLPKLRIILNELGKRSNFKVRENLSFKLIQKSQFLLLLFFFIIWNYKKKKKEIVEKIRNDELIDALK